MSKEEEAHTNLVKHLVALIEDKNLAASKAEVLFANEGVQATWGGDNDVWVSLWVLEDLGIGLDWGSSVEDSGLNLWHVLGESGVLVLDLVGKLTSVAHNEDGALASDWLDLLEGGENEDGSLTKTGLGLAEDIGTENSLWNANLLDCKLWSCQIWSLQM